MNRTSRTQVRARLREHSGHGHHIEISLGADGGQGGIRTLGTRESTTVFETAPFDHSGTCPNHFRPAAFLREDSPFVLRIGARRRAVGQRERAR